MKVFFLCESRVRVALEACVAAAVDFMQPVFLMCLQSLCNVAEANQQKWLKGKVKPWPPLLSVCFTGHQSAV